ncbi:MAG: hypothetical protein ACYCXF_07430 [Thermoleophilia bacterium]
MTIASRTRGSISPKMIISGIISVEPQSGRSGIMTLVPLSNRLNGEWTATKIISPGSSRVDASRQPQSNIDSRRKSDF